MIHIAIIAGMMVQYGGYGSPPPSLSYQSNSNAGVDTAPFVQLQRKCFDQAVRESEGGTQDVKQQRFDACYALHDAMVKHATAKLGEKEAAGVKHDIDRALGRIEKSYAKKLGAAMPEGAK
jgi:hypothetical protein